MKKVYQIRITGAVNHPAIWYANKRGAEYEAELGHTHNRDVIVFRIDGILYVHPEDCMVIGETIVEQYRQH